MTTDLVDDVHVLSVDGELDVSTAPEFGAAIGALLDAGALRVVVDMTPVDFLDSTALRVLVNAYKRLRDAGGALVIVCPNARVSNIFRLTALDRVFTLRDSIAEALAALRAHSEEITAT